MMKSKSLFHLFYVLAILCVLSAPAPPGAQALAALTNDLDILYHPRGLEVVELRLTAKTFLPGGSIRARVMLVSKTVLTYGMSFSLRKGTATGAVLDELLASAGASIPLEGMRTLDLGAVTFGPDAQLSITLDKFGSQAGEAALFGVLDLAAGVSMYAGGGPLAGARQQYDAGTRDAAQGLLAAFIDAGLDQAALAALLDQADYTGAFETFGGLLVKLPEQVSAFLADTYAIQVTPGAARELGRLLAQRLPAPGLLPLQYDFMQKPDAVQVEILGVDPVAANIDVILTIDSSDSMYPECLCAPDNPDGEDRIGAAQEAARAFIDQMHNGDSIGVVSFGATAVNNYPLTGVSDTTRAEAKDAVDAITSIASTSIGAGLQAALDSYQASGNPANSHSILLITDGYENTPPYASDVLPDLRSEGITVYTIGLGDTADASLLRRIADETGGTYTFSPGPADLAMIYNQLVGVISGGQMVVSGAGSVTAGSTHQKTALISGREATFTVTWENQAVDAQFTLRGPSGQTVNPSTPAGDPSATYVEYPGVASYHISSPEAGEWTLRLTNPGGSSLGISYTVYEISDLKLDVYANANQVRAGEPITLSAALYGSQGLVTGASVSAAPTPGGAAFDLLDDGTGGDAAAGDGIYAAVYTDTGAAGNHKFVVDASTADIHRQADFTLVVSDEASAVTDLWVIHKDGPPAALPSETFSYQVDYGNNGPNGVKDATLIEFVPTGFELVSSTLGAPFQVADNRIYWAIASIPANTHGAFTLTMRRAPGFTFGVALENRISLYPLDRGSDSNANNNQAILPAYAIYRALIPAIQR